MPQTDLQSLQCKEKCGAPPHTTTCAAILMAATLSCVDTRALTGPDCPSGCTECCKEGHTAIGYVGLEWGPPRSAVRSRQGACRKADGTKASVDEKWGLKDVAACRDACEKSDICVAIEFSKPEPASGRAISKCAMLKEDPYKMVPLDGVVCLVKPLAGWARSYSSVNLPGSSREAGRFRRAVCGGGKHCQNLATCVCCRLLLPSAAPIDSGCTHFREFDLRGANLYNSKLDMGDFSGALLDGANLRSATLHGANFEFTSLDKAMMDSASANSKTSFEHASLKGASLRGVGLSSASLKHASFAHADLSQSDLSGVNANDASFVNATLSFASLTGVMAENANFSLARLDNAFFSGGNLKGAFFRGADLTGASFNDALIEQADFTGARGMETASWAGYTGIPYNAPPSILGCPAAGCASGR